MNESKVRGEIESCVRALEEKERKFFGVAAACGMLPAMNVAHEDAVRLKQSVRPFQDLNLSFEIFTSGNGPAVSAL
jgi:hypothetical protein